MRQFTRLLAAGLAAALAFSVPALAFTDDAAIRYGDAAAALTEQGIFSGYPDGSFQPERNVSRAELSKLLYAAVTGSAEAPAAAAPFSDVPAGSWASGYIAYCAEQGIVNGMGDGTFRPNDSVTGTQAAKMMLVTLDYDAGDAGFTGLGWNESVTAAARQEGLYDGLTGFDSAAALTREEAAQMLWNLLSRADGQPDKTGNQPAARPDGSETALPVSTRLDGLIFIAYDPDAPVRVGENADYHVYNAVVDGKATTLPVEDELTPYHYVYDSYKTDKHGYIHSLSGIRAYSEDKAGYVSGIGIQEKLQDGVLTLGGEGYLVDDQAVAWEIDTGDDYAMEQYGSLKSVEVNPDTPWIALLDEDGTLYALFVLTDFDPSTVTVS